MKLLKLNIIYIFLLLLPKSLHAQSPTYYCTWKEPDGPCVSSVCPEGYQPGTICEEYNDDFGGNSEELCKDSFDASYPCQPISSTEPVDSGYPGNCEEAAIDTAIGCINIDEIELFLAQALAWSISLGGGTFLLISAYAGFTIMTSTGDPRKLQRGQELLMSAIAGLLILVLSVLILRFIGVDLLGILV